MNRFQMCNTFPMRKCNTTPLKIQEYKYQSLNNILVASKFAEEKGKEKLQTT